MKFTILDQGRGSDCINAKRVHAFRQFEAKMNATQGLGLGLYFVQNLCKLTGSVFEIHSKFGEGTKAIVKIPLMKRE